MKKVFYERVVQSSGRVKYVPVHEYDSDLNNALPRGAHLIMCQPGGQSTRYNVEPNHAAMIAAGKVAESVIANIIHKQGQLRPMTKRPMTDEQRDAYEHFMSTLPEEDRYYMTYGSSLDAARAAVDAMTAEATKLLENETVKIAYHNFQLLCLLTRD